MKLHQSKVKNVNQFTGYDGSGVKVNDERFEGSILVLPNEVHSWRPTSFADLLADDFAALLEFEPELVLLGTGGKIQFPHPQLFAALSSKRIGLDAMDTGALCRTFNVLTAEDRRVLALVLHS